MAGVLLAAAVAKLRDRKAVMPLALWLGSGIAYRLAGGGAAILMLVFAAHLAMDCCAHTPKRVDGDAALHGYCYGRRSVFCVTYYDTGLPC